MGVRHLGTPDKTLWGGPQSNDGVEAAPAGLPESIGTPSVAQVIDRWIAPRIAGIPVKSALKKISKDEQRRAPITHIQFSNGRPATA